MWTKIVNFFRRKNRRNVVIQFQPGGILRRPADDHFGKNIVRRGPDTDWKPVGYAYGTEFYPAVRGSEIIIEARDAVRARSFFTDDLSGRNGLSGVITTDDIKKPKQPKDPEPDEE